jgi:CheY-like chemotaxis protein
MQYAVPKHVFAAAPKFVKTNRGCSRGGIRRFEMFTTHPLLGPARIILAEDDRSTARLMEIGLKRSGVPHDLKVVHDGLHAIALLETETPDLLLVDVHMPGKNGFEVLAYVKGQDHLRRMPVVMFSSSGLAADVNRAYDLHANAYVMKQTDFAELCRTLDSILQFWLRTATPPSRA